MKRRTFLKCLSALLALPALPGATSAGRPFMDPERSSPPVTTWHSRRKAPGCVSPSACDDTTASFEKCLPEFIKRRGAF